MESSAFGHPGEPRTGDEANPASRFRAAGLGLRFEGGAPRPDRDPAPPQTPRYACDRRRSSSSSAWPPGPAPAQDEDWPAVGNDKGGMRYSPLAQIDAANVARLEVAWVYHTGDAGPGNSTTIECTPIVVEGRMYVTTARTKVACLDAATGREIWQFDPYAAGMTFNPIRASGGVNRGVAYWSDGKPDGQRRIFLGASDGRLISLDASTGKPDPAFGKDGILDLRDGIEWDVSKINYGPTSAPAVFEDTIIVGFSNGEGQPNAPGDVRAFDAHSGKEAWRFHTVPRPGEPFHETWHGDTWKRRGGANAWGGFTIDEKRGIVFCGTGSCSPDFFGGDRKGDNLFANCTLALDARTGKRLWHFQQVHHDLWDYDNPCPPVLVTVTRDGKTVDAVAQLTKVGLCFLFERETGKPIFEIVERPVPQSDVPGEHSSPTQPFPVKPPPYATQGIADDGITDIDPATTEMRERPTPCATTGMYTPPSLRGTAVRPAGTAARPGAAGPSTRRPAPSISTATTRPWSSRSASRAGPLVYGPVSLGYLRDKNGYLGSKPPWGMLNAIDVSRGEFAWRTVLGESPELKAKGVPQTGHRELRRDHRDGRRPALHRRHHRRNVPRLRQEDRHVAVADEIARRGLRHPVDLHGRRPAIRRHRGGRRGKLGTKSGDSFVAFALPAADAPEP